MYYRSTFAKASVVKESYCWQSDGRC